MEKLKEELYQKGASLVGFGNIEDLYTKNNPLDTKNTENETLESEIPHYPVGISIAIAIQKR